jgi:hypothetical protein
MKRSTIIALLMAILVIGASQVGWGQIISQYVETNSGTTPKGIEIWNNTASTLDFATNNLVIQQGTNGAALANAVTISTGTLAANAVLVIGTSDIGTYLTGQGLTTSFTTYAFTFNGDDALAVKYGATTTDIFGTPGSDPGASWVGGTVNTANQNIALLTGITTGASAWTDPSLRFSTVSTTPATLPDGLAGFGIAPAAATSPAITVAPTSLSGFNYTVGSGPSTDQSFTVSGANLTADITVTAPTNYEISLTSGSGYTSPITLTQTGGTVASTTVYARLKAGLSEGTYNGELIACSSTGATTQNVTCNGSVSPLIVPPAITVGTVAAFSNTVINTVSAEKTYTVSGTNLTNDIVITPPAGFEISTTTGTGFVANPATITLAQTAGTVASTTIYVRFAPTVVQVYTGNITHTSTGATTMNVAVTGAGVPVPPALPIDENFNYTVGTLLTANGWTAHSGANTFPITVSSPTISYSGYPLSGIGNEVSIVSGNAEDVNYGFSSQSSGSVYASLLVNISGITGTSGDYFFHYTPTSGTSTGTFSGRVYVKKDASSKIAFGIAKNATAVYTNFDYDLNTTYLLVLKYTFNATTGTDDLASIFVNPSWVAIEPTPAATSNDGSADATAISAIAIRQGSTTSSPLMKIDGIRVATSWGQLVGTTDPTLAISPSILSGFNYLEGNGPSTSQSYTVSGANLTGAPGNITITGSTNYEVSTDNLNFSGSANIPFTAATLDAVTVYTRLKAGLAGGSYNGETIAHNGGGVTNALLTCNGSVTPTGPSITVGTLTSFGNQYQYTISAEKTYTVSGLNLTGDVTITPPTGFQISLTTGTGFSTNPVVLTPTSGTLASTTIYVRFAPTLAQAYTGNITHVSTGATSQNVAVSGTGIAPVNVNSIAALRAGLQDGTVYRLSSEALVTFQRPDGSRNQLYIQDATAGIVIDDLPLKITTDYNIGDGVTGITGTLFNYSNLLEFLPVTDPGAPTSTGNPVVPQPKTIATITTADQAELVSLSKVTFTQTGSFLGSANYTITDASGSMIFRTIFTEADYINTPIPATPVNLVGLVGQFNADMQFTPRFSDDFTLYLPSWTSGYPKAENPSPAGFTAKVNLSDPGIAYYVVLPNGAPAPSALQVKNGQDASGTPVAANLAGTITCTLASTEYQDAIAGLTSATTYNVYFVAEAYTNLQASPVMVPVTTSTGTTAPVLLLPTVSAISTTSAILGGEISTDGGAAITERGTVWSTTSPVTIANNKLAEGGTSIGVFSHLRTSLPSGTQIYYAAYATNINGTTLSTQGSFYTFAVEPSEHVTAFTAGSTTTSSIALTWTDAAGAVPPTAYLVKASNVGYASIADPVDGTPESDGTLVKNIAQGVQTVTFTGLSLGTTYYFKIYPYTGASATINYKTAATVPTATAATLGSSEYTWSGADNASWVDAANWSPNRTTPQASDILFFNDGTTKTITAVANETVGQIILSNNTTINLKGAAAGTLTIGGTNSGTDLVIPAGCALNINGTFATTLFVATGATASISGTMAFSGTTHKMNAADAAAIVFNSGASLTQGLLCTGNVFTSTGTANVVRFMSGSTFYQLAGSNPYGLGAPNSKVEFQTGSLFKFQQTGTPAFSNRSCANFEVDHPSANINVNAGTSPFTCDNLTVSQGTLGFVINLPLKIKGNITVASGATFNYNPSVASYISMEGTLAQTISGAGTITLGANTDLIINNLAGVTIDYPLTINGTLTLTNGLVSLAGNNVTMGATASILGTPSASKMIVATGAGELRKVFTAAGSFTFPVGDNTGTAEYSPVTLNFTSGTFASAYAGVNLVNAAYPGVSGSYLDRYWNISASGISAYSCNATFNYTENDVIGTESSIYCYRVAPGTDLYDAADVTNNILTATLSDIIGAFTGKEQPPVTKILNVKFFLEGLFNTGTGLMNEAQGGSGAQFGTGIADQVTIELRESTAPYAVAYTFADASLNTDGTVAVNTVPGAVAGDYYVVVNHRNSIQTWSAAPVSFAGSGPIAYDFTTSASQAYGNNMRLMGTNYVIYGGDASQDGIVDGTDMALIDNASTSILQGYNSEDVNGDGIVDGTDMALIDNNSTAIIQIQKPL